MVIEAYVFSALNNIFQSIFVLTSDIAKIELRLRLDLWQSISTSSFKPSDQWRQETNPISTSSKYHTGVLGEISAVAKKLNL